MLTVGIFCLTAAALVFGIGLGVQPSPGKLKRWWRWRMLIGGSVGMLCGILLILVGIFN